MFLYLTDSRVLRPYAGRSDSGKNAYTMYFTNWGTVAPILAPPRCGVATTGSEPYVI